jgi:hypothetical protein
MKPPGVSVETGCIWPQSGVLEGMCQTHQSHIRSPMHTWMMERGCKIEQRRTVTDAAAAFNFCTTHQLWIGQTGHTVLIEPPPLELTEAGSEDFV